MTAYAFVTRLVSSATTILALAACGVSAGSNTSHEMPPVHVQQTAELLNNGVNEVRQSYQRTLADCEAAGLPTRALSSDDAAKLGTTRYSMWYSAETEVIREESWDIANDGGDATCLFRLEATGSQETTTADRYEQVDLATGERVDEAAPEGALERIAADPEESTAAPGFTGPSTQTVAGQPCNAWSKASDGLRQCVWSAGAKWGFSPGSTNDYRPSRDLILLEQTPTRGAGYKVTTQLFTVGAAFDRAALKAPAAPARQGGQP